MAAEEPGAAALVPESESSFFFNDLVNENTLGDDFDMLLPPIDGSEFLQDGFGDQARSAGEGGDEDAWALGEPGTDANRDSNGADLAGDENDGVGEDDEDEDEDDEDDDADGDNGASRSGSVSTKGAKGTRVKSEKGGGRKSAAPPPRGKKSGITTKGASTEAEKKAKRRKQIAAASRASRARRKRELEDLREENQRLREERAQFLTKIGELQVKVENMRERGSTDMRVENALLRAQLEEHKRFISHFKHLCDGAPSTLGARHVIYKQGSDSAQAHVLGLISQSMADEWVPGRVPANANIPYQNFHFCYKFKTEYGEKSEGPARRQRLNVRVDLTFPGFECSSVSDFLWNSFSNVDIQQRLYRVNNIELTQLADDMPDKDTKMVYFREKVEAPQKDQDWVVLCNRQLKQLARSTLSVPPCHGVEDPGLARRRAASGGGFLAAIMGRSGSREGGAAGPEGEPRAKRAKRDLGKVNATVLAMSTTQHSVAQFESANRITSMFVQGAVTWDEGGDARLVIVFSFPDEFKLNAMEGFSDVLNPADGTMSLKFASVIKELNELLGEQDGDHMPLA